MAKKTGELLGRLRALMKSHGQLSAYIVPSDDAHMSEYVCEKFLRRGFVSGFTGSAGTAVVLMEKALLWTDGRYFLQAEKQMDENWTLMKAYMPGTPSEEEWLSSNLSLNDRVGIDPKTCSITRFKTLKKHLSGVGIELVSVEENLVDLVWDDAPSLPDAPVFLHSLEYAGEGVSTKLGNLRKQLKSKLCDSIVLSALDDIAWLYNLRGNDVNYNPVFYSFAVIDHTSSTLYVDENKLTAKIKEYLANSSTAIKPYDEIYCDAKNLDGRVFLPLSTNAAIFQAINEKGRVVGMSPVQELKAIKNEVELEGMRNCHIRDGAALTEYLHWLQTEVHKPGIVIDEVDGSDKAAHIRSTHEKFVSLSFDTISSSGSNGAVIHYKPEKGSCLQIDKDDIYLCDSGAQYSDGTTDVTRTVHLGIPSEYQMDCFTRVLMGHIDLAMAVFPPGTKGTCLDCLARRPLWNVGLNYQHGTGHGVGSFLNVHEGPCRIAAGNRMSKHEMGLKKGMILSNEPGFYESGKFGMRIESLVEVVETSIGPEDGKYLTFSTITMAPIERKLINTKLMTAAQVEWLNQYHLTVREKLGTIYDDLGKSKELKDWLIAVTEPL